MLESDRLPNVMKVPEVYSLYCQSSYREGERGGDGEGEEEGRERGEKGRRGRGEERRGGRGKGERRGGGGGGTYAVMSLCLCSDVKKN